MEELDEMVALEQWDGLALSQQLSEVCLYTPLHSPDLKEIVVVETSVAEQFLQPLEEIEEVNLADQEEENDRDDPQDQICSQDVFCTPDFITPIEQQFPVHFDVNKDNTRQRIKSPTRLTPLRYKRPRPDPQLQLSTWLKENEQVPQLEVPLLPEKPNLQNEDGAGSMRGKLVKESACAFMPSHPGVRSKHHRVDSPVCIRNPFVQGDSEENADTLHSARPPVPLAPRFAQSGMSRYSEDFHEIQEIGQGNFSRVYKVLKRIDGCLYAVKRSIHQLHQDSRRKQALTEVQALAAIGMHENVVRYHTAWFESDYLYIQMELCDSTLGQYAASIPATSLECSLLTALWQMAKALSHIHAKGLVHLDLKPDNIYVLDGVFKLGDFGCATRIDGSLSFEEGDARYIPLEFLNEDYTHLCSVDMFSLGASIYELATGVTLPSSGPTYKALREGKLAVPPGFSSSFENLLKELMHPNAKRRPLADDVLKHPIFSGQTLGMNLSEEITALT
ncbi:hypothetical protein BDL97_08G036100 [Sphagnum fallax]|nr:hypothetical protein BDL97_08G036100 [Sphagnum fallax]